MRVILREDVEHLGSAGEIVNVRDGYSRNYLFPRGMASMATESDVKRVEHERRVIAARMVKLQKDLQGLSDKIEKTKISIARAVGEGDKLYGSVTNRDIAESLAAQGIELDARKIVLDEPIKTIGLTEVVVKLGRGIEAKVKVWVVKQDN